MSWILFHQRSSQTKELKICSFYVPLCETSFKRNRIRGIPRHKNNRSLYLVQLTSRTTIQFIGLVFILKPSIFEIHCLRFIWGFDKYYFRSVQLEKKNAPEYASSENTIEVNSLQLVGEIWKIYIDSFTKIVLSTYAVKNSILDELYFTNVSFPIFCLLIKQWLFKMIYNNYKINLIWSIFLKLLLLMNDYYITYLWLPCKPCYLFKDLCFLCVMLSFLFKTGSLTSVLSGLYRYIMFLTKDN